MKAILLSLLALALSSAGAVPSNAAEAPTPSTVRLKANGGTFQIIRNGAPYFIKGAGGSAPKDKLKAAGGNSFRTWGAQGLEKELDEAHKLGLTVSIGIWLGHKRHGFNYADAGAVAKQFEDAKRAIDRYKDHPALLVWGIGNEMEMDQDGDPAVWQAVEQIAAYAKKADPNHPTMTVIAEIGGNKVEMLNKYCPSIDIVGINTYGGGPSIPQRYPKAGGVRPYIFTEYGPPGRWEVGKNAWGAAPELSSTDKADRYRQTALAATKDPLCLGGYAFTWGFKQEATSTWFGMLLPDGSRLGAVDAVQEVWTGKPPSNRTPQVHGIKLTGTEKVGPGATMQVALDAFDPESDPTTIKWLLQYDPASYGFGGDVEAIPPSFPEAIVQVQGNAVTLKMPKYGGGYRLFAQINDNKGGAATANLPIFVEGGEAAPPPASQKATLPLVVYDNEGGSMPFIPSGYMGETGAIEMDHGWADKPHAGKTAIKVQFTQGKGWGGVVWQSPANDWGEKPGGFNLAGAKRLSFWARGDKGGENVEFSFGLIGKDKKFPDSAKGSVKAKLATEWQQYSIDLDGKDLSHIKSGFCWTLAPRGEPMTFYLDDIRYK